MSQQDMESEDLEVPQTKEEKAARNGLIEGIASLALAFPFAYVGGGLMYWLSQGVGPGFCGIPLCLGPIALLVAGILTSVKGRQSSRSKMATIGLVLSILAIIVGIVAAILGFMDGTSAGGLI